MQIDAIVEHVRELSVNRCRLMVADCALGIGG